MMVMKSIIKFSVAMLLISCFLLSFASCQDKSPSLPSGIPAITTAGKTETPDPFEKDPGEKYRDGYYALAKTEIPFISSIDGKNVDCTLRFISTVTKLGRVALFAEVIRDGEILSTEQFNGACAVMATAEKTDRIIILQIVDNLNFSKTTKIRLNTYFVSDVNIDNNKELDAPKLQQSRELSLDTSYVFSVESISGLANPEIETNDKLNEYQLESLESKASLAVYEYELSHSEFYCVINAITNHRKPSVAFPSDKLPVPDIASLKNNTYLKKLNSAYSNYKNFIEDPDNSSKKLVPTDIPAGMEHGIKTTVCDEIIISYDWVNYRLPCRRIGLDYSSGGVAGVYIDVINVYEPSLMASIVIEGYCSVYFDNSTSINGDATSFILEHYNGKLSEDVTVSCAEYQFTDLRSPNDPKGKKFGFNMTDPESSFNATLDLRSPDQSELDLLRQFGDRIEEMIKKLAAVSLCAESSSSYACGINQAYQHADSQYLPEYLINRYFNSKQ